MKPGTVAALLAMSTPAFADGPYAGGFVSGGAYGEMGWTGQGSSRSSTMLGGFAGYDFQAGGLIFSPEARVHTGTNKQVEYDETVYLFGPAQPAIYRTTFKERLGGSIGVNIGAELNKVTPYVGGSLGLAQMSIHSISSSPTGTHFTARTYTGPAYSLRAGADINFDYYFIRAEVEHRWIRPGNWATYRQTQASVGFGIRF